MKDKIKILFVEDVQTDAEIIWREISKNNIIYEKMLVQTEKEYVSALKSFEPDIIISDYSLPEFDGMSALKLKNEILPDVPFILVTGSINEEVAVEVMKTGADDYVIKENLTRLGSAIEQTLVKYEILKSKNKIEEDLKYTEMIFNAFLEYCPVYFFFKDNEAKPVRLSRNFEKMFGRPVSEVLGKSMYDLFPHELARAMIEDDLDIIRKNAPKKVEEELEGRIYETIKFPIQINEELRYCAGFTIDITEKKLAEGALMESDERFRMLFDKAPIGYQSLDFDGNFIEVNETWLEMMGYTHDEVIGKWFGDFLAPDFVEPFRERFPLFKEWGHVHSEFVMVRKDGSVITVAFDGRVGRTPDGEFKQTHCVLDDVTELRIAEQALSKKVEELEQFNDLSVDRELKMIDLKNEVNTLLKKLGEKEKYKIAE